MTTPTVSVVMSVYNAERFLREAVESILNQSFSDFEFIIVNDGSTDRTGAILQSYTDRRITVINQENAGVTKALNNGLALATGKYVARQDADDVSKPQRLEKQVAFMEGNPAVGLLGTRFEFIDENGEVTRLGVLSTDNKTLQQRLTVINQFSHGSVMIRKEALDKVGYFREFFRYAQDYDLWLRIADHYNVCNLPDYLFRYRELEQAISSSKILTQSLYAGIAAEMAAERRETGSDALQNGELPPLPSVQRLSGDLKQKLTDFYSQNPREILNALNVDVEENKDLLFLLEQICADKQRSEAELNKRNEIILMVDDKIRQHLEEHHNRLISHLEQKSGQVLIERELQIAELQKALAEKTAEVMEFDERLRQLGEELTCAGTLQNELEQWLDRESIEIVNRQSRLKQFSSELRLAREQRAELENQLRQQNEQEQELAYVKQALEAERKSQLELQNRLKEKEERIDELLHSMSWKVTAPLRAICKLALRKK
jgi:hypothetical protein